MDGEIIWKLIILMIQKVWRYILDTSQFIKKVMKLKMSKVIKQLEGIAEYSESFIDDNPHIGNTQLFFDVRHNKIKTIVVKNLQKDKKKENLQVAMKQEKKQKKKKRGRGRAKIRMIKIKRV